ncbi:NLR family CARD domain-containing protein 3-like [Ixodes scapularis]
MSTSAKRKRPPGPQGLRKPTTVAQLRTYFRHHSLDLATPCSAPGESARTTSNKASHCWVVENLKVWNSVLHSVGVELRENVPGSLTLRTFVNCNPSATSYHTVCAFLVARLINNHRCVQCVDLGYVGELFGGKSMVLSRLRPNAGIRQFVVSGRLICDAELNALVRAAFKGAPLVLRLHQVVFGRSEIAALSKAITTMSRLTDVDLCENGMKGGATIELMEAVEISAVKSLKIEFNMVGIRGAQRFAELLTKNKTLSSVSLFKTKLKDKGAVAIAGALATNDTLQHLMMGGNSIGLTGAKALASSLEANSSLLTLDLRDNNLGTAAPSPSPTCFRGTGPCRSYSLVGNQTLRALSIHANYFGDNGVAALARLLSSSGTLVKLNATCKPSLNDATQFDAFAEALAANRRLEGIELSLWGSTAIQGLSRALRLNTTLRHLSVRTCVSDLSPLLGSLEANKSIEVLELHIVLSAGDGEALSNLLRKTTTIRSVIIPPRMSNACLVHLVQALSVNTSVWWFRVSSYNMRSSLCEAMAEMFSINRTLNSFILDKVSADEACLQGLANGLEYNLSLVQLAIAYPASSAGGYRISSLLRRNWSLMNLAMQFALKQVADKRAAEAFQVFRQGGLFVEELNKFLLDVFQTWLEEKDPSTLWAVLRKSGIDSRLMEFFPVSKRSPENFTATFKAHGISQLLDYQRAQEASSVKKDLQQQVINQLKNEVGVKEIITSVKEYMTKYSLPEHDVAVLLWTTQMSGMDWNKKEELVADQALKHLKQYTPLLEAFTTTPRAEVALLVKVQEFCYDNMNFMKVFQKIVILFYKTDVLSEDSILKWYKGAHSPKGKSVFLDQMKRFVDWLQSAEEESEGED